MMLLIIALLCSTATFAFAADEEAERADRPLVIAHRGASGYLPELTLPAFTLAHAQGSDYIETDVQLTKDGRLINLHDLTLNRTTNVEQMFPGRARPDGKFYAIDFTFDEIRSLTVDGPADRFEGQVAAGLRVPAFEEYVELVQQLNRTTGRPVGMLVEVKEPEFHREEGRPIEERLLGELAKYGYDAPGQGVIVQSFGDKFLQRLREEHGTKLPLVWLIGDKPPTIDLAGVAKWADGIAPSKKRLQKEGTGFAARARDLGLTIFCYTFKDDTAEMRRFTEQYGLDGVITDFPDKAPRRHREHGAGE